MRGVIIPARPTFARMALTGLLLGLVTAVLALVASSAPVAAWTRTRDPRFLLIAGADLALLAIGVLAVYGNSASRAPAFTSISAAALGLVALAALALLVTGLWPRRSL